MRQVKCIKPLGHLTRDRIYTVVGEPAKDAKWLTVVDDRGECATYDSARFEVIHSPKATPDFSQMQRIADEVKITCEKITCPVIESVNDQIMKTPLRTAHERIVELEAALNKIANHRKPPMHHSMYEGIARAVLKRGAQ